MRAASDKVVATARQRKLLSRSSYALVHRGRVLKPHPCQACGAEVPPAPCATLRLHLVAPGAFPGWPVRLVFCDWTCLWLELWWLVPLSNLLAYPPPPEDWANRESQLGDLATTLLLMNYGRYRDEARAAHLPPGGLRPPGPETARTTMEDPMTTRKPVSPDPQLQELLRSEFKARYSAELIPGVWDARFLTQGVHAWAEGSARRLLEVAPYESVGELAALCLLVAGDPKHPTVAVLSDATGVDWSAEDEEWLVLRLFLTRLAPLLLASRGGGQPLHRLLVVNERIRVAVEAPTAGEAVELFEECLQRRVVAVDQWPAKLEVVDGYRVPPDVFKLQPGDLVVAARDLDPNGCDAKAGALGVVFQEANYAGAGTGPRVRWTSGKGGCCNVYPGWVKVRPSNT